LPSSSAILQAVRTYADQSPPSGGLFYVIPSADTGIISNSRPPPIKEWGPAPL